ncbi:hypothetical protein L345_07242 [Ophiophagus hannah]|uniref:Uncharacterized protein n=1 Tax=Ophiophagus hannah TaxID=8665 RepID=V8NYI3_OPHHA|nr:hypothetical protein L345_07242 [Ophiophagus hannah]
MERSEQRPARPHARVILLATERRSLARPLRLGKRAALGPTSTTDSGLGGKAPESLFGGL